MGFFDFLTAKKKEEKLMKEFSLVRVTGLLNSRRFFYHRPSAKTFSPFCRKAWQNFAYAKAEKSLSSLLAFLCGF